MRFLASLGMTRQSGGLLGGISGDSHFKFSFKSAIYLRIATSALLVHIKDIVILSASEGSLSSISVLSKTDLLKSEESLAPKQKKGTC